jgi:hypothetical protein
MTKTAAALLFWAPRIAAILLSLLLALFALDSFDGRPLAEVLPGFAIHLIPAALVLAVLALAWRVEWLGALIFIGLAIAYAIIARWRLSWIVVVSAPLTIVGVLFLLSWRYRGALPPAS